MTHRFVLTLASALIAFHTIPANARTMHEKMQAACAGDVGRLCPDQADDPDRLKACMLAKREQVGPACMRLIDASE